MIKNENEYLEEWLNHHRELGFNHFFIYDNCSDVEVKKYIRNLGKTDDITCRYWKDNLHGSQLRVYEHCCNQHKEYDYIAFIDTDEFIMLNGYATIQEFFNDKAKFFDGLGIYWRMYGGNYTNERLPMEEYKLYFENPHIKSIVNPKKVERFYDPHKPNLIRNTIYKDELGNNITSPLGIHTSQFIYIKHIWTRSLSEWNNKLKRGQGDKVVRNYGEKEFIEHNKQCVLHE